MDENPYTSPTEPESDEDEERLGDLWSMSNKEQEGCFWIIVITGIAFAASSVAAIYFKHFSR